MEDNHGKFNKALFIVLDHEGGLVDDKDDPGGITNYGISLRTLSRLGHIDRDGDGISDYDFNGDGAIDADDIRHLDQEQARLFYFCEFWDKYSYGQLPLNIAIKIMDFSVNMGPKQAHRILQRALRANGHSLKDDGIIGNITRTLVTTSDEYRLIPAIRSEAAGFYRLLTAVNPVSKKYLSGWLRRAYS